MVRVSQNMQYRLNAFWCIQGGPLICGLSVSAGIFRLIFVLHGPFGPSRRHLSDSLGRHGQLFY